MPDKILNSKTITGPLTYVVRDNDDVLNVNTILGVVTLVFANIRGSGFNLIQKQYYVNDIGNNASINNIILQATGGDQINNNASFPLTTNGASVQLLISSQTEWLATGDISNGGSPILADNGLTMSGSTILFGGNLIVPTTLNALGSNTFSINDQAGLFLQTRDADGNFFFNNIGGTGTLIGSSGYVFSYLGDGGNVFEDTFIVINFGGANYIKGGTDFWNFGDYTIAEDNYSIFSFGRFNQYYGSAEVFLNGYNNVLTSISNSSVNGSYNILANLSDSSVVGNNNFLEGQVNYILGQSNLINSNSTYLVGSNNVIDNSTNSTIIGLSNQLTLSNDTTLIGLGNTITANANSVLIGFVNYGIKLDDSVLDIGLFGGTSLVSFNYSVTPSIVVNVPTSPVGLPSKALWDNVGVINITP